VVSLLAKVCGFNPGRGRWILRAIKIRSTTSFGGEVKPAVPYGHELQNSLFTTVSLLTGRYRLQVYKNGCLNIG
jgi:hypothetical protein